MSEVCSSLEETTGVSDETVERNTHVGVSKGLKTGLKVKTGVQH